MMPSEGSPIKVTVRGLTEGYQSPLKDFWGKLDHYVPRHDDRFNRTLVDLGFTELEVIVSTEPYRHPIAQITIPYGTNKNSSWGVLAGSVEQFLQEAEDFDALVGATLHMVLTPGHNFGNDRTTGEPMIRDCWEVTEVRGREAGGTTVTPLQRALDILDNKTEQDFNQVVLADPIVKKDAGITNQILSRAFLPALEASGQATKDEAGIWHTKKAEAPVA